MSDPTPGPGTYALNFHIRGRRIGVVGSGEYTIEFTIPADVEGAHAAIANLMADLGDDLCELLGIPKLDREAADEQPAPIATGPGGEFPADLELIYQAFKGRLSTDPSWQAWLSRTE